MPWTVLVHFEGDPEGIYARSDQVFATWEEADEYGCTSAMDWEITDVQVVECCRCGGEIEREGKCVSCL